MTTPHRVFDRVWHERFSCGITSSYVPGENLRVDAALAILGGGDRLLDVGCGPGTLCLAAKLKFKEIHGVDIAEQAVSSARNNGVLAVRVDLNVECLPYSDGFFDAVTILAVLPYVYDPQHALRECHRVLRPGGTLLLDTANIRTLAKLVKIGLRGRFPSTSKGIAIGYDGGAMHYFCSRDLRELLVETGFRVVKTTGVFYRPGFFRRSLAPLPVVGSLVREFFAGEILVQAQRATSG